MGGEAPGKGALSPAVAGVARRPVGLFEGLLLERESIAEEVASGQGKSRAARHAPEASAYTHGPDLRGDRGRVGDCRSGQKDSDLGPDPASSGGAFRRPLPTGTMLM